ncbi:uncharacterized protein LOC110990248 isoform X2 [Acanthaster planci]|uniref:Uncharacterized protein LOC110990248 isoform X2 n=1 Tax=Acanthaster planci TaxID=133434 RepID=A0A8B7ZZ83_ACAPL|nr:uncharacterized protein LOC110990248 isoform X2 [Acanthaster planci]
MEPIECLSQNIEITAIVPPFYALAAVTAPSTSGTGSGHGSVDELDNDASTSKQQATSATTTDDPNKESKTKKEEKKKTDKKAMERPTAKFTKEDAIGNAASYFTGVLSSMKDHPMFNLGNTTTLQALAVITQLLLCINEAPVQEFCTSAVTALWFILESDDSMQLKEQAYMNIWVKYH